MTACLNLRKLEILVRTYAELERNTYRFEPNSPGITLLLTTQNLRGEV